MTPPPPADPPYYTWPIYSCDSPRPFQLRGRSCFSVAGLRPCGGSCRPQVSVAASTRAHTCTPPSVPPTVPASHHASRPPAPPNEISAPNVLTVAPNVPTAAPIPAATVPAQPPPPSAPTPAPPDLLRPPPPSPPAFCRSPTFHLSSQNTGPPPPPARPFQPPPAPRQPPMPFANVSSPSQPHLQRPAVSVTPPSLPSRSRSRTPHHHSESTIPFLRCDALVSAARPIPLPAFLLLFCLPISPVCA